MFGGRTDAAALRARTGDLSRLAGVTPFTYGGARDGGVRALDLRSGAGLNAVLVADRALDALELSYRGIPLTWLGPGGLASPHAFVPALQEFERDFFGGLMTTCGLTAFGPPGSDADGTWSQHGRINMLAADVTAAETCWDEPPPYVRVTGTVREERMFGERLRLERTWTMPVGGRELHLHDRVFNDGSRNEPHMLLYHCNAGYPLLDETTEWRVTQSAVTPRDDVAAAGLAVWHRGGPPQPGFREQVFTHVPVADAAGWAHAEVANASLGLALRISFRPRQLPALFTWRMLGVGTYVMAAEPANCPTVQGRIAARHNGTLPLLAPGEARDYELRFVVVPDGSREAVPAST